MIEEQKKQFKNLKIIIIKDFSSLDKNKLVEKYSLPSLFAEYIMDKNGPARLESSEQGDLFVTFWFLPKKQVRPKIVSVVIKKDTIIFFCDTNNSFLDIFLKQEDKNIHDVNELLLDFIIFTFEYYLDRISDLGVRAEKIQISLDARKSSQTFDRLTILNRQIVYLRPSISENSELFSRIDDEFKDNRIEIKKDYLTYFHRINLMDRQLTRIFESISQSVQQLSDTYDRLINNNLNSIMRFLTIWSLLLAIPPIVSGFYGMNMHLPFAENELSWFISLIITLLLMLLLLIYLHHHHSL